MTHGQFFKWSTVGLNSVFYTLISCHMKVKELSLPYYLPVAGGRIVRCARFQSILVLCEMQTASPGFELVLPVSFRKTITINPRVSFEFC